MIQNDHWLPCCPSAAVAACKKMRFNIMSMVFNYYFRYTGIPIYFKVSALKKSPPFFISLSISVRMPLMNI